MGTQSTRWGRGASRVPAIRFIAASQGLDSGGSEPGIQRLLHLLGAVAQFERELIRERVTAGIAHARKQGKLVGRPRKVFNRDELVRMRRQGQSIETIARQMRLGVGTVVRVLQSLERHEAGCQKALA